MSKIRTTKLAEVSSKSISYQLYCYLLAFEIGYVSILGTKQILFDLKMAHKMVDINFLGLRYQLEKLLSKIGNADYLIFIEEDEDRTT